MDPNISINDYKELFELLARGMSVTDTLNFALPEILESVEAYRDRHHFYHWPLEFPDVFGPNVVDGFSATVGNPPWDIVKPNSQEFFSDYDTKFRSHKKQAANRVSMKLMADNPAIVEKWEICCDGFAEQSAYFKEPLSYTALGKGDINTFKLFLEQFFTVLGDSGRMGIVVPSGIYTDQGCQPLRERFFNQSRIEFLYCFENRRLIFNIHRSFKFVLFGTQKGGKTDRFKGAFMEHDPELLPVIDADALKMSVKQVKKFSPDTLSVMEFKNQRDIDVTRKIYGDWPLLGEKLDDSWNVRLTREFDTSTDSGLFKEEKSDCPLYEGKIIWSYDNRFSPINYWLAEEDVRQREIRKKWRELSKQNKEPETYDYLCFRCGFRRIAASTNERTCLSTMIPPMVTCPDTTVTVSRIGYDSVLGRATELISLNQSLVLLGYLNSFALDFVVRQKITTHLDMHFMYGLPVPRGNMTEKYLNTRLQGIVSRVARLVCASSDYESMWALAFRSDWTESDFWYPSSAPIDTYGPAYEQEIRRQLRDKASEITPEWGPHCGVHDRLPDRRDTGDRAQLRAEIDAYVAHLYGLSRDDFAYILDTFPVLKKKEKKAFGEFMSKRKCLEEYDRIAKILTAEG